MSVEKIMRGGGSAYLNKVPLLLVMPGTAGVPPAEDRTIRRVSSEFNFKIAVRPKAQTAGETPALPKNLLHFAGSKTLQHVAIRQPNQTPNT